MSCPSAFIDGATLAREVLGISVSLIHKLRRNGEFGPQPVRIGSAVRWSCEEVTAWVAAGTPNSENWKRIRGHGGGQ